VATDVEVIGDDEVASAEVESDVATSSVAAVPPDEPSPDAAGSAKHAVPSSRAAVADLRVRR
jgi:hypothetical protein